MNASISVVLVNYNAGSHLRACVDSILSSLTHPEIIIIDNASTDNSLFLLKDISGLHNIHNTQNYGFSTACNQGIAIATCPNILFLNPDCILASDTITKLLLHLTDGVRAGMVGGLLTNLDGSEQQGGRRAIPTPWRSFVRAFSLHHLAKYWPDLFFDFHLHKQPLPTQPIEVEAISGACMLVKREAIEEVGLWDEGYFLHCEDLDWCMRFRQKGWKILFVPDAKVTHALGACSKSRKIFVEWHKHKGMIRFYNKFFKHQYSKPLMALVIIGVSFRFLLVASFLNLRRIFNMIKPSV